MGSLFSFADKKADDYHPRSPAQSEWFRWASLSLSIFPITWNFLRELIVCNDLINGPIFCHISRYPGLQSSHIPVPMNVWRTNYQNSPVQHGVLVVYNSIPILNLSHNLTLVKRSFSHVYCLKFHPLRIHIPKRLISLLLICLRKILRWFLWSFSSLPITL